eukprot:7305912-Alexandrium_andersonii.AAC.1
MRDSQSRELVQKAWGILSADPELARRLRGHLCDHSHGHQPLLGSSRVAASASYPRALARWLARFFLRPEDPQQLRRLRCALAAP